MRVIPFETVAGKVETECQGSGKYHRERTMKSILHKFTTAAIAATAVLIGAATVPFAQEVVSDNDAGVGARAMGMGGAQIAAANDVTAIVSNPAALARLKQVEVQMGLNLWKRKIETNLQSSRGIGRASENTDFSGLGTIAGAYPVPADQGSLVFAASYNRVKDFSGRLRTQGYSDILTGKLTGESIEDGGMGMYSFAGALDVSPNVSVGASIDIWDGDYKRDNRQLLNDSDSNDSPYSQLDITSADDDITAWSFKPGFLYFQNNFRLGGFLRFPMTFNIDERYSSEGYHSREGNFFNLYEIIDPTSKYNDSDYTYTDKLKYKVKAPMQLGLGVALGHTGGTIVAFDVNYENWKQAKLDYPSYITDEPNYFLDKYKTATTWKIGIEQPIPHIRGVLRAGYLSHPITFVGPRTNESGAPQIEIDNDRDYITCGFGVQFDPSFGVDMAYTHGYWRTEENPRSDKESRDTVYVAITYRGLWK